MNCHHCVYVFHTKYDHGVLFNLKYNHDIYQKHKIYVFEYLGVIFLLNILFGMYETYFIMYTSKKVWTTVWVDIMTIILFKCFCQY